MVKKDATNKGKELRELREEKGLSRQRAVEFFGRCGYDFSTKSLQNWEAGDREPRDVDLDALIELLEGYQKGKDIESIEESYDISSDPQKHQRGSGFEPNRGTTTEYRFFDRNFGTREKPVPDVSEETVVVSDRIIRAELGRVPNSDTSYWARVNGESMEPYLQDGAPILVEEMKNGIEAPGRYVLYQNSTGGIVKRCDRLGEDTLHVASDNRSFPTQVLRRRDSYIYEDGDGHSVRLRVQGRIVYPKDTAHAMKEQAIHDVARAIGETASWGGS